MPFVLSAPWEASVTLLEATTPVKLPAKRCPPSKGLAPGLRKGGISTTAHRTLAHPLHCLPPILHIRSPGAALSCSKGSRGLSVPLRVGGIFTATTIIRAGRNLPDKEFRYLRTVIVTAAVYRGFGSAPRRRRLTPPLNLPAPGRCQALCIIFRFRKAMCFW